MSFHNQGHNTPSYPYCQFLLHQGTAGLAITQPNIEAANFRLGQGWQLENHQFRSGETSQVAICSMPRLVVLNRSQLLMANNGEVRKYNRNASKGWQAFSYIVVLFLDSNNQILSELPFRLRCSKKAGTSFLQAYDYYNRKDTFLEQLAAVYEQLHQPISDKAKFAAHAVFCPELERQIVTSQDGKQSSPTVLTGSYIKPTPQNYRSLIIVNGSPQSQYILAAHKGTKDWVKMPEESFV